MIIWGRLAGISSAPGRRPARLTSPRSGGRKWRPVGRTFVRTRWPRSSRSNCEPGSRKASSGVATNCPDCPSSRLPSGYRGRPPGGPADPRRESLLDVRTGTRGGGRIRIPSTETAAQLAGIVLESEQTTFGDVWEARTLTEPTLMGLAAERIDAPSLERLRSASQLLGAATNDTPLFTNLWTDAELLALGATGNPAITVAVEIIHWVREGCRTELTADALNLPWVERSNRRAQRRLDDVVSAATRSDAQAARDTWTDYVRYNAPFFQSLGDRLILDMLD